MSLFSKLSSFFGGTRPTPNSKPNGGDGIQAYGGFLASNESSSELTGTRKWVTYSNATNTAIVATGLRYALGLLAGTKWHAEPNERGGADADRGVEIVEQGLISAQMPKPWSAIVRKTALYKYYGFSLHEWTTTKRSDGMIVFAELAHRPQHTIDRWDKPSEQESWHAVMQQTRNGNQYTIPRGRLLYAVDDTLTDSPEGVGLFRHIVELVRRLGVLEGLEGLAYQTDIRGMPIGRAPITDLMAQAEAKLGTGADVAKINAYVSTRLANITNALTALVKTPEKLQHLVLDSGTFRGASPDNITSIQKWGLELLRGDGNGVAEVAAAIGRIQLEIARVMGIEFAMVGGLDSSGSYGMHADKTGMFATCLQTTLTEIADFATNDLARVLVGLNGLDPETCTPRMVAEPISTDAIESVCRSLTLMAQAGLAPNDPARAVIRERLRLPPEPPPDPNTMGLLLSGAPGGTPVLDPMTGLPAEPPDPALGEEDIEVDDLGADPKVAKSDRTIASLISVLSPAGECAECGEPEGLEVDHIDGRDWMPRDLSKKQRAEKYWSEYDEGVRMRALCRSCNGRDGAKNKQPRVSKAGTFDESKHPRAPDGKFGSGGGGGAARSAGSEDGSQDESESGSEERDDGPDDAGSKRKLSVTETVGRDLDEAHHEAAQSIAALSARAGSVSIDGEEDDRFDDVVSLLETFDSTSEAFGGKSAHVDAKAEHSAPEILSEDAPDKPDKPDKWNVDDEFGDYEYDPSLSDEQNAADEADHKADRDAAVADYQREVDQYEADSKRFRDYNEALASHEAGIVEVADKAQTALEALHARQLESLESIADEEFDEDNDEVDPDVARDALKSQIKQTAAALKQLGKVTGRKSEAVAKPKPKAKKPAAKPRKK